MTAAEYQSFLASQCKGGTSKYHSNKCEYAGITFDSNKEACRYAELILLQEAHIIRDLALQVPFVLHEGTTSCVNGQAVKRRAMKYVADFVYEENRRGKWVKVVEDCKGFKTKVYLQKKRLMKQIYQIDIFET